MEETVALTTTRRLLLESARPGIISPANMKIIWDLEVAGSGEEAVTQDSSALFGKINQIRGGKPQTTLSFEALRSFMIEILHMFKTKNTSFS